MRAAADRRAAGGASARQAGACCPRAWARIGARTSADGSLYRASKAALNSVLARCRASTYGPQGATCVAFHPGWVQTDMGGAGADVDVERERARPARDAGRG